MLHRSMVPYLAVAAVATAVFVAFDVPLAALVPFAIFLACPIMMFFMMRGMGHGRSTEDHTGHACEHDPTRTTTHQHTS